MNKLRSSPNATRIKILVVDDHPNTATTLARAIAQLGSTVEVFSATSGPAALELVKDGAVDILITDMVMPEMTGLELIEKLNNHPAGCPTFLFLMTAFDVPGLKVTARRLKVKEVILKPVHPERICQIITQVMEELDQARPSHKAPDLRKSFSILIADDKPDNLTLLARYLENEGYGYIKAEDGLETLEKVRSESPDLVLLDINMPHKDGFTVLEEIRADPATQHIPVIILTAARLGPTEIQFGLNLGADDYVTKPFDRRELIARIRTKLRVKEAEDVIRRRNSELNLLPQIGKELSARLSLDELATILLKRTVETLGAIFGHLVILADSNQTFQKTYRLSPFPSFSIPEKQFALSDALLESVNKAGEGFILEDTSNDPRWQSVPEDSVRSAIVIPLFGRHNRLGMLVLANEQANYFNQEHLLLLQAIASQASIAVENACLYSVVSQEQQRLAAVLQSAADAILMFDMDGCLSLVNPAGQKLFTDYQAKVGQRLPAEAGYDSLLQLLDQTQHSNDSFSGEIVWPDQRVFSASMTPVPEGGCVVVLHDVTHFKKLEKVKDEFIATASHDLKNPIASIRGFSDLIKRVGDLNDHQNEFVQRIQHAADHMAELVENMLDLAKMDLGMELKQEEVDMGSLLAGITDEFKPQAETKQQNLRFEVTATRSEVRGDALQLRQALRNLIGNAIKYTPCTGAITLSLEHESHVIHIKIKDTGYGIPSSDLPFIFNRFYRVRTVEENGIEGNGLGLAIVKSVVDGHGGKITVESEPGNGSCFTVTLPLIRQRLAESEMCNDPCS